jgi:phosphoenolpyruvate carboxykinase (ATP)
MLSERIEKHGAHVWLINTGWTGGAYGTGARIKLANTRAILTAIHAGKLAGAKTTTDPIFQTETIVECPGVPGEMLDPRSTWSDSEAYDQMAQKLAGLFVENFKKFADNASESARKSGPRMKGVSSVAKSS